MKHLLALLMVILASASTMADPPTHHGMLLFGEKQTYVSHLPMFHGLHAYQLIMKVELDEKVSDPEALSAYTSGKLAGKTLFTIFPEKFDLTRVMDQSIKVFSAILFDGHFERGGNPLGKVQINVVAHIISNPIGEEAPNKNLAQYIVFGEDGEYFAAHKIFNGPSFDFVAKVSHPIGLLFYDRTDNKVSGPIPDFKLPTVLDHFFPKALKFKFLPQDGEKIGDAFGETHTQIEQIIYQEIDELKIHHSH